VTIQVTGFRLPSGSQAVRGEWTGVVDTEDADTWRQEVLPGGRFHGLPILAVGLRVERLTPEARRAFVKIGNHPTRASSWMAVVVVNPVIRVTANFVIRLYKAWKIRLFATEEDAVRWLDEYAAQPPGARPRDGER